MKAGESCIALIKKYEGCRLEAYKCLAGIWTIGYGHTGGIRKGQKITQAQADAYLKEDIPKFEKNVSKYGSKYGWNQNEFDALVSFAYNIGSIDQLTASGTRARTEIADKMLEYNKINKKVHKTLQKRREEERELFLGGKAQTGTGGTHVTIKKGSKGEDVGSLQRYLYDKGYYVGAVDSIFGDMLEKAVKLYQYDTGLAPDGIAGQKTWEKIEEEPELRIGVYSYVKDKDKKISANFSVKEFRCKDKTDRILIDAEFVKGPLQKIRDHFKTTVTINSGYRTIGYNKKVGGASGSYHLYGRAFDIDVQGHSPEEVAKYAQTLGINGIIQYNTFVHVDSREIKYWARNDNGNITIKKSF